MPQMMPLNWLMLMMFFMALFFIFMNLFYFNKTFNPSMKKMMKPLLLNSNNNSWLW
uniref:ATP synthase F0 subunit 8 n=1 Tax=Hydropsyche fukienensis TaxID=3381246 RepID=UPI0022DCE002|nr:ATP synthase F0 subunit 8 [Ceratopsyche fukienensis]UZZ44029.1 ATP synthase F0 subunit 8 [Ceratopsyche fukienensis]